MDKWTARKGEIEMLIEWWLTLDDLAAWYGVCRSRMFRVLRRLGLETRRMEQRRIFGPNLTYKMARARAAARKLA